MVKKKVLQSLIDAKKIAILKTVLFSKEELYLKEITEKSAVPLASTFRILQELVKLDLFEKREWKNSKVYFSKKNEQVAFLKELFKEEYDGLQEFVGSVQGVPGVQEIILQGGRKKNQANVLLIGAGIDGDKVENVAKEVRQNGFELSFLTLTKEQYAQMSKMGLYSGKKEVLS